MDFAAVGQGRRFLRDSLEVLEGLKLGGVGVWRWRIGGDELSWTENLADIHDLPRQSFDGTLSSFRNDIHPDDVKTVWETINHTLATGKPYQVIYRTAPKPDGSVLWIEASGGILETAEGRFLTGVCMDVTQKVLKERELHRRLRQQEAVSDFGSFALAETALQPILERAVNVASEVLDVPFVKILRFTSQADRLFLIAGKGWQPGLVGQATVGIDHGSQAGYTLKVGGPVIVDDLSTETRFSGPALLLDHGVRSGMSVVITGEGGRPFGVFGVHTDESRKFDQADANFLLAIANIVANSVRQFSADQQKNLLVREMAHRAGNMLQLVSTIANQTFHSGCNVEQARRAFGERLMSVSRANLLIARGGWSDTRFAAIVEETLQPFRERIQVRGPDILLPPELSFDLGLVLHELSTNSAKYGSLGTGTGKVEVSWQVLREDKEDEDRYCLRFAWKDPARSGASENVGTGFGSRLIRLLIERKWNGAIKQEETEGYCLAFDLPLAGPPAAPRRRSQNPPLTA